MFLKQNKSKQRVVIALTHEKKNHFLAFVLKKGKLYAVFIMKVCNTLKHNFVVQRRMYNLSIEYNIRYFNNKIKNKWFGCE